MFQAANLSELSVNRELGEFGVNCELSKFLSVLLT
jgi:hypothetical protein